LYDGRRNKMAYGASPLIRIISVLESNPDQKWAKI